MTNAQAKGIENAAPVADQAVQLGPHKAASSNRIVRSNKVAPNRQKGAKGKVRTARKKSKAGKRANAASTKTGAPRAQTKGAKILELIGRPNGASLSGDSENNRMASSQRQELPVHRRAQVRAQGRIHPHWDW